MASVSRKEASPHVAFAMETPLRVPARRYFDREFHELEKTKLWYRTWQMACRLQEIPETGDFVEYEICDQSIVLIRQADSSIKAFHNACRHRATELCKGAGSLTNGELVCPFHGWRWRADGSPSYLYGAKGFAPECMRHTDLSLRECKVEIWGGCAWINLDPDASSLMDALQSVAGTLGGIGVENLQVKWWKETVINVNWKIALEAFLEAWHVMQTHPKMTFGMGKNFPPDAAEYRTYSGGHSTFTARLGEIPDLDSLIASDRVLVDGQDAMVLDRDIFVIEGLRNKLKPGDSIRKALGKAMRDYNQGAGIPMVDGAEDSPMYWAGEVFLFPNFLLLPYYGNALSYRVRPYGNDPERCRFEVWSLTTYPLSRPVERAKLLGRFDISDSTNWGEIPRQDFGNMERQQRGLHSLSFESHRLAIEWESPISNLHLEIDRRLSAE